MRLLTRSDFDGLACGSLLREVGMVDSWQFVHPKDMQDGFVTVTKDDILANVPYVEGCKMWFDHHSSEEERLAQYGDIKFEGVCRMADSCARIIYEYYNGDERMPHLADMIKAVDKVDAAKLTADEVLNPKGWILLGFIMDPRTGLGRFRDFKVSNYELMKQLMEECRFKSIDEILALPDVKERTDLYFEQNERFKEMLRKHTRIDGNVIITDLRDVSPIYSGNRFIIYSMFPEQNISVWIVDGRDKKNAPVAVGHSIINRTSKTDVGKLLLSFGGGGHHAVGTCQLDYAECDKSVEEMVNKMKQDG
jgi:nanoRNase/pAp phosphatase (c-di-AMP/oligoRNAs hydrolase)